MVAPHRQTRSVLQASSRGNLSHNNTMNPTHPRYAMVSTDIRRDLLAPMRHFARLEVALFYRRAPYQDLSDEDWPDNLVHYSSPRQLYRLINQVRPNLVQGVEPFSVRLAPYLYSIYVAARSRNVPLVIPTLENRPVMEKYGPVLVSVLRLLLRRVFTYASLIIYLNQGALRNIRTIGSLEAKAQHLMYGTWGVDLDEFRPGQESNTTRSPQAINILFVGRLTDEGVSLIC